ncbi:hypothetical protein L4D09_14240 [Photobacterium makurazakiensis]|uniref:hypothetical protein n=1 Tax=Photobacterium makurazakiensis TaxID=2910234 RepID=UPI003D143912
MLTLKGKIFTILSILSGWVAVCLGAYTFYLHDLPVSNSPKDWADFATFFTGVTTPLSIVAASIAAYFVCKNFQQDRDFRRIEILNQSIYRAEEQIYQSLQAQTHTNDMSNELPENDKVINVVRFYSQRPKIDRPERVEKMAKSRLANYAQLVTMLDMYLTELETKLGSDTIHGSYIRFTESIYWIEKHTPIVAHLDALAGHLLQAEKPEEHQLLLKMFNENRERQLYNTSGN